MRHIVLASTVAVSMLMTTPIAAQHAVGVFGDHMDIGAVASPGSATFDEATGEYTVASSGANMWFDEDQFHFVWRRMSGDVIINAMANLVGEGTNPHRKAGIMLRANLSDSSRYVGVAVHGDGLVSMQFRREDGADTEEIQSRIRDAEALQLARHGGVFSASAAQSGDVYTTDHIGDIDLGDEVYAGIFVCAHDNTVTETATFRNVRVTIPAAVDFQPYQDYIGGNLEILDIETGRREIVMRSPNAIQAPNWTPDGKTLIYNEGGLLYNFDVETRTSSVLDTDFATRNNNDHVLSFDGTKIAISHHSADDDGQSIIYWLPVEGGTPTRVTPLGPSYLHGWSPDARWLTYTGGRDGVYDIYKIPIGGGQEIQLTDEPGLDDGPEYSPDGEYIYFNSTRSGKMKLWRMRPDGSDPEQLTFDAMNDWFPHISPDGQTIVFISYEPTVAPDDHPWYKQVYLRKVPVNPPEGVRPEVIAYVYGGQGTINVPSWSPDGRFVAFVSNSDPLD